MFDWGGLVVLAFAATWVGALRGNVWCNFRTNKFAQGLGHWEMKDAKHCSHG